MKNMWSLQRESILYIFPCLHFTFQLHEIQIPEHFCNLKMYTLWKCICHLSQDVIEASLQCCHMHALHFRLSMPQAGMQAAWVFVYLFGFGLFFGFCSFSPILMCFFSSPFMLITATVSLLAFADTNCESSSSWTLDCYDNAFHSKKTFGMSLQHLCKILIPRFWRAQSCYF